MKIIEREKQSTIVKPPLPVVKPPPPQPKPQTPISFYLPTFSSITLCIWALSFLLIYLLVENTQGPILNEHEENNGAFYPNSNAIFIGLICLAFICMGLDVNAAGKG